MNLSKISEDVYHEVVTNALNNASELVKLVSNDIYAETLIKAYGQLRDMHNANAMESFNNIIATDPDFEDKSDEYDLIEFQTKQAREALTKYLEKKMNAWYSGAFSVNAQYDFLCEDKSSARWYSFDNSEAKHMILEDNLEVLIMFVNK